MLNRFRSHFGSAGMVVAIVALVAALAGSAYAAKKYVVTSTKQIKPSVLKELKGKEGKAGANGANGTNGTNGAKGDAGAPGKNGIDGSDGKSVAVTPVAGGEPECAGLGGAMVEVENTPPGIEVCNGEEGAKGEKGEPWTVNNTLPKDAVETGAWSFTALGAEEVGATISFSIPLMPPVPAPPGLEGSDVHYKTDANFGDFCEGGLESPKVKVSGTLCVYEGTMPAGVTREGIWKLNNATPGASAAGALVVFITTGAGHGWGSWALRG